MASGRGDENQRRMFDFLRRRFVSQQPFSPEELTEAAGWDEASSKAALSKHLCVFTQRLPNGRYRITQAFRRYRSWKNFKRLVTQTRRPPRYTHSQFDDVLIYEFLLPLSNEEYLRGALDTLFYEDTIRARLDTIPREVLEHEFPRREDEPGDEYFKRMLSWISDNFQGYSVYHVQGRFRTAALVSRERALQLEDTGERYLIDETTAVARFIFPCKNEQEMGFVQFFFKELFVESIVEVVSGEDQIWMVEGGSEYRVHVWSAEHE